MIKKKGKCFSYVRKFKKDQAKSYCTVYGEGLPNMREYII